MRSIKTDHDKLVTLVIKVSTALILGLMLLNVLNVMAQSKPAEKGSVQWKGSQEKVRQIYSSQIGTREKGYNSGATVERYLRYVNLPKGNPWCAAFVCWVYGEAGVANPRSGWSPNLFASKRLIWRKDASPVSGIKNQESRHGGVKLDGFSRITVDGNMTASRCACPPLAPVRMAQPGGGVGGGCIHKYPVPDTGDVFGLYFKEKGRIAHVGFIDEWDGTWLITVEGNTNIAGGREGDGVYRKRRLVKSIYQVARYIKIKL